MKKKSSIMPTVNKAKTRFILNCCCANYGSDIQICIAVIIVCFYGLQKQKQKKQTIIGFILYS